jgi:hypothetical protein
VPYDAAALKAELPKEPVLRCGCAHRGLWFDAVLNAGGGGFVVLGRVAGTIVVNEFGTRGAAKGTDKFVGVALMRGEASDQLEDERLQICPAARSGISRSWK